MKLDDPLRDPPLKLGKEQTRRKKEARRRPGSRSFEKKGSKSRISKMKKHTRQRAQIFKFLWRILVKKFVEAKSQEKIKDF